MPTILKYAAGVTTILSLLSFLGGLYVWLQSQRKEKSVVDTIKGEGIVQAEGVVAILKEFKSDDTRLQALQQILGYSKDRASDVLDKVKSNIDVRRFSLDSQGQLQRRLVVTGIVLITLAVLSIVASRVRAEESNSLPPSSKTESKPKQEPPETKPLNNSPEEPSHPKLVYIDTQVKEGGFTPPNLGPQVPGCSCGSSTVTPTPPHLSGKVGEWQSFTWDAHWLCQGQGVKNPEASVQWDGHFTEALPSWAGTAKVRYPNPGSYVVNLKASGNCVDSNNGGAACWPNGNHCSASGTVTIDVLP